MSASYDPRLVKGVLEFNQGLYFEAHESWEEIWREENGEERLFYQGLIQIAAGYLKWEQGVLTGSVKLWRSGLEKLQPFRPLYLGIDLDSFLQTVGGHLKLVEAALRQKTDEPPALAAPVLSLAS
jgi:predicted metal-dependent hydrolase